MFEKIVLRRSENSQSISIGELCEALLFYQNVHLILDFTSLIDLGKSIGLPQLLSLLNRPNITAVYCEQSLGTQTTNIGVNQVHSFVGFSISGNEQHGLVSTKQQRIEFIFKDRFGYSKREARKLADNFLKLVPVRSFSSDYYIHGGILKSAITDLDNKEFIISAIQKTISLETGVPEGYLFKKFEIINTPNGFYIFSDIDYDLINRNRNAINTEIGKLTNANLINTILIARADTALAAHYGGDFYTSNVTSEIIRLRYADILKRTGISAVEKSEFQNIVIADCPSIKEVMNTKNRSFDEFLKLLDKSQKFRDWIQKANPDDKLVHSYIKEVTSPNWGDKLPTKIFRYILTSATSLVEPITGQGLSLADSLLLDKIIKGWRPNHFVENNLKPFLNAAPKK